jgi:hypothetical protein
MLTTSVETGVSHVFQPKRYSDPQVGKRRVSG